MLTYLSVSLKYSPNSSPWWWYVVMQASSKPFLLSIMKCFSVALFCFKDPFSCAGHPRRLCHCTQPSYQCNVPSLVCAFPMSPKCLLKRKWVCALKVMQSLVLVLSIASLLSCAKYPMSSLFQFYSHSFRHWLFTASLYHCIQDWS